MNDLVKRLRRSTGRSSRHEWAIGDYWNLCDEAADRIDALEAQDGMPAVAQALAWEERAKKAEKALEVINMLACYASEEDTDSREQVLLQIGKLARGEVSASIPTSTVNPSEKP